MFSIFLGFSGAGGGGSSAFLGMTYGPTSFCGPPASGGASCLLGFAGGCCDVSCVGVWAWAWAGDDKDAAIKQNRAKVSRITRLHHVDGRRFEPPNTPLIMGNPRKSPVLV